MKRIVYMINDMFFKELVKMGHSKRGKTRVWDLASQSLHFSTPELAHGFLNLGNYPVYRKNVIEREVSLIKSHAKEIKKIIGNDSINLVDAPSSQGVRAGVIAKILRKGKIQYCPVNANPLLTANAIKNIKNGSFPHVVGYSPQHVDIYDLGTATGSIRSAEFQKNVIMLMGNAISTLDINDFLFNLSREMFKGDHLIIGNGIRTGKRLVNLSLYKHQMFDEWYVHLVRGLGFSDNEVKYDARFGNNRIECFYKVLVDKKIAHNGKTISFHKGDEILVGTIYKYYAKELEKFCKMYFSEGQMIKDEDNEHAIVICKK